MAGTAASAAASLAPAKEDEDDDPYRIQSARQVRLKESRLTTFVEVAEE